MTDEEKVKEIELYRLQASEGLLRLLDLVRTKLESMPRDDERWMAWNYQRLHLDGVASGFHPVTFWKDAAWRELRRRAEGEQ